VVGAAPEIAIIGAGMAGLTCARALNDHGLKSIIFDKGRGLGGRMATRRVDGGFQFDHGAQYLSARSSGFVDMLHRAEAAGAVARWPQHREPAAFIGVPGMTGLAKHLSRGLDIRTATQVQRIVPAEGRWLVEWEDGEAMFDRVVVTAPAPQIAPLLPGIDVFNAALQTVAMDPCLTLMIGLPQGIDLPFVTRRTPDEDISWIACDSTKPGRPIGTCVVAQASSDWSLRHLEQEPNSITDHMLRLVTPIIGTRPSIDPVYISAHRWRYAFTGVPLGQPYLHDGDHTLFAGGDWCLGAKAENAWTSGRAIADAVVQSL
jgi:predicted NAD/FAD-dependent oxidoreductase